MFKSYRVQLKPNNKQISKFIYFSNVARYAYNWGINKQKYNRDNGIKFSTPFTLGKEFNELIKNNPDYKWMENAPPNVYRQAFVDLNDAYQKFFKIKGYKYPKYKSKAKSLPAFFQRGDRISFKNKYVKLTLIGRVKIKETDYIPNVKTYYNCRISYDGINWWLSVSIKIDDNITNNLQKTRPLGIDLGLKNYITLSDGTIFENINKNNVQIKNLRFKINKLNHKLSKLYKKQNPDLSNRTKILILKIRKLYRRITNIRYNYIFQIINIIIKRNPEYIVIEDLNLRELINKSNKNLRKFFREASFYKFITHLEYKCKLRGIKLYKADRFYPSSKICSNCGHKKIDLKLSDRTYICSECGLKIDRDLNAAINLEKYPLLQNI